MFLLRACLVGGGGGCDLAGVLVCERVWGRNCAGLDGFEL